MVAPSPSPYDPFVEVESVSLDAFLRDTPGLKSRFFRRRQQQLGSGSNTADKAEAAALVGRLSRSLGSFWVELEPTSDCINEDALAATPSSCEEFTRDGVLSACRALFTGVDLPTKNRCRVDPTTDRIGRGFLPLGAESGAAGVFENKEGFAFGSGEVGEEAIEGAELNNRMEAANVFPPAEQFSVQKRQLLETELVNLFNDLGSLLLRAYSLDLYKDENELPDRWGARGGESWSLTRIFHYFRQDSSSEGEERAPSQERPIGLGSVPHTDWGLLTFIVACDEPGLQISGQHVNPPDEQPEQWFTVRPQFEKGVFVNCGDFMALWSRGEYVSPRHRVVSPIAEGREEVTRTSVVHFFYPNYETKLPVLTPEMQKRYSTFADQRQAEGGEDSSSGGGKAAVGGRKFGEVMADKWIQVAR